MSWSSIISNQHVSLDNLKDAVTNSIFTAKTTIPSGGKHITKTEANTYVNINTAWPSYAAKASNQLVTKQDLTVAGNATLTFSFVNAGGSFLQFIASLSVAVNANINIERVFSDGFPSAPCFGGTSVSSAQVNSTHTIASGNTGVGYPPESTSGVWASATKYGMYNIIINGVPVLNGNTITVGSYTVTVIIPSCA